MNNELPDDWIDGYPPGSLGYESQRLRLAVKELGEAVVAELEGALAHFKRLRTGPR